MGRPSSNCRDVGPITGLPSGEVSVRKALVLFCVQKRGPFKSHSGEGPPIAERVKTARTAYHWTHLPRPLCARVRSINLCVKKWNPRAPQPRGSSHSLEGKNGGFRLSLDPPAERSPREGP